MKPKRKPQKLHITGGLNLEFATEHDAGKGFDIEVSTYDQYDGSSARLTKRQARRLGERLIAMADWLELYGSKDDE